MLWGKSEDPKVKKGYALEQLCINYKQASITSSGGPRTMFTVLPLPEGQWQPSAPDGSDSLSNSLELARHRELPVKLESKMGMLCTKLPEYDEATKCKAAWCACVLGPRTSCNLKAALIKPVK